MSIIGCLYEDASLQQTYYHYIALMMRRLGRHTYIFTFGFDDEFNSYFDITFSKVYLHIAPTAFTCYYIVKRILLLSYNT